MSLGVQILVAIAREADLATFQALSPELFLPEEEDALERFRHFVDQHHRTPPEEGLVELGIRPIAAPLPVAAYVSRLRERWLRNTLGPEFIDCSRAVNESAGNLPATLDHIDTFRERMDRALSMCRGETVVVSEEAARRIAEKYGISTFAQLRDEEIEPTVAVVHNLIGEGASLLSSGPKAGKTTFLAQVAVAVATGQDAFGSLPVRQGPVLYLALEDPKPQFQSKLRNLGLAWPANAEAAYRWDRIDQGGLQELETYIAVHRPRLVVIDTIKKLASARKANDGKSLQQAEYDELAPFQALAGRYRCAIVIAEHTNKGTGNDPITRTAGSHGKTAAVDNVLLLTRSETQTTIRVTGRTIDEGTTHLQSHPATFVLRVVGPNVGVELRNTERLVYEWLRQHGEHGPEDIARGTGRARATVSRALAALAEMYPPRVDGAGATSARTYIAMPEPVSVFAQARREGRVWGRACTPLQRDPDMPGDEEDGPAETPPPANPDQSAAAPSPPRSWGALLREPGLVPGGGGGAE